MKPIVSFVASLLISALVGCQSIPAETAAIQNFHAALEKENLEQLRAQSTERFQRMALRRTDAMEDLKKLGLPKGEIQVVETADVSPTEKHVQVEVGAQHHKLKYHLVGDPTGKSWVVDDIFMKQRRGGVIDSRTVTEQMDLLITLRGFLEAAAAADREALLAAMTEDFAKTMNTLPDSTFSRLSRKIASQEDLKRFEPDPKLDRDLAVVRMHRLSGELIVTLKSVDDSWKVDNLAVESREDQNDIKNMRKLVNSMRIGSDFLLAYKAGNRDALKALATPKLFESGLAFADLSTFPLAVDELLAADFQIRAEGRIASILIPNGKETLSIDLVRDEFHDGEEHSDKYLIEGVTLYRGDQQIQMSAAFASRDRMQVFADAVRQGRYDVARIMSTPDFGKQVWSQLNPELAAELPLEELRSGPIEILSVDYRGKLTSYRVRQGDSLATYQLRNWNGEQLIDDVLLTVPGRPESIKQSLQVLIPARKFLGGLRGDNLDDVRRYTSDDFNLLVWRQLDKTPPAAHAVVAMCQQDPAHIVFDQDTAQISYRSGEREARVQLRRHDDRWSVDDVQVAERGNSTQIADLKQTLRAQIASGEIRGHRNLVLRDPLPGAEPPAAIQQVGYERDADAASPYRREPRQLPSTESNNNPAPPALRLDDLPSLPIPVSVEADALDQQTTTESPEILRAHGESPLRRPAKRTSSLTPIWKQ